MPDSARTEPIPAFPAQEIPPSPIWQRQDGEPALWYRRFKLFRALGPRRTLLAALEQEQSQLRVLKGTQNSESEPVNVLKKSGAKAGKSGQLVEVEKPKPAQVPGSWKRASIQWNWMERAAAYDEHRLDQMVETNLDAFIDGLALSYRRIQALRGLYDDLVKIGNSAGSTMNPSEMLSYFARLQSIIRDMREEMRVYDEAVTRVVLRHKISLEYHKDPSQSLLKPLE